MSVALKGKTIIITGASQGLGKTLAFKASKLGARVLLVARTQHFLKEIKQQIIKNHGQAEYFICDIRNLSEVKKTIKEILNRYKNVDVLINNAGVWTDDNLEKTNPNLRKIALETNVLGNIQFTKELLPHFQNKNKGYIFNVISTSGLGDVQAGNNSLWQTYGATKWAMTGFTKALKDFLKGSKIKITGFFPGGFDSNLYENVGKENPHNQPWMMKTEDVADIIIFALTRPDDVLMERIVVTKIQT